MPEGHKSEADTGWGGGGPGCLDTPFQPIMNKLTRSMHITTSGYRGDKAVSNYRYILTFFSKRAKEAGNHFTCAASPYCQWKI